MYVNVTRLELVKRLIKKEDRTTLLIRIQDETMKHPVSPMLHSQKNIIRLCSQLRGQVRWDETVAFGDLNYTVESYKDGLRIRDPNGTTFFAFPGPELADAIAALGPDETHVFSEEELERIREQYAPRVKLKWHGEAKERYMAVRTGKISLMGREARNQLHQSMLRWIRIAKNRSDGELVTVNVSPDHLPYSFYIDIRDATGKRVMNGGTIAHETKENEDNVLYHERKVVGYEYQNHT